jgi:hypothetical protein
VSGIWHSYLGRTGNGAPALTWHCGPLTSGHSERKGNNRTIIVEDDMPGYVLEISRVCKTPMQDTRDGSGFCPCILTLIKSEVAIGLRWPQIFLESK